MTQTQKSYRGRGRTAGADHPLVDAALRRFPWPADPSQRYSLASPLLAVVNARGPWAVWRHKDAACPPYIPLCLDLLDKPFWRRATNDQRVFALTVWIQAARQDWWGIVWGDPVRLCYEWEMDAATFEARLEWMIGAGLACYLTRDEAEQARTWGRKVEPGRDVSDGGGRGKPEGGLGGSLERGKGGKQSKARQVKTRQDKGSKNKAEPVQIPDPSARNIADSRLDGQGKEDKQAKQAKQGTASKSQAKGQSNAQGQEPASLPESDPGAGPGSPRTTRAVRGRNQGRPRSVPRDAVPIGDLLAWQDPRAVAFGRAMYEAIHGHAAPPDLSTAPESVRGDVGVWVHYWVDHVRAAVTDYQGFENRCVADVSKKRKCRRIRNLGGLARKTIVPGVLAAMRKARSATWAAWPARRSS